MSLIALHHHRLSFIQKDFKRQPLLYNTSFITMSSDNSNLPSEKLNEIRATLANGAPPSIDALHEFFTLLVSNGFEPGPFVDQIVQVVVSAMKHPAHAADIRVQLFASNIMCYCVLDGREENAISFLENGGLDRSLEIMQLFPLDTSLLMAQISLLAPLFDDGYLNYVEEQHCSVLLQICNAFLAAMDQHSDDGAIFRYGSRALWSLLSSSSAELTPELNESIAQRAIAGVKLHTHHRLAQTGGRRLLTLTAGDEGAREMLGVDIEEGPFVSEEVAQAVHDSVFSLRSSSIAGDEEVMEAILEAIETLFKLVRDEGNQNLAFKGLMVSMKTVQTILTALKSEAVASCPDFLRFAAAVLACLLDGDEDLSTLFLSSGGVDQCAKIATSEATDGFTTNLYMGNVGVALANGSEEAFASKALDAFGVAFLCMWKKKEDPNVYSMACMLLHTSIGPHLNDYPDVVGFAAQLVFDGIVMHQFHEEAQENGRNVLRVFFEADWNVIEHTPEMRHF